MDLYRVIVELRAQLELIDDAILSFERLASANHPTREKPPALQSAGRAKESGMVPPETTQAEPQVAMGAGSE
ncbi:MAG: hypothetical protein LAQ69_30230 [Acidobacteriia bacterium]|nr:hypothetical protein [Terriglobia bacterium]